MKDRVPLYPGRVKLDPVSGQQNVFDMVRADEPQQEGTPINKKTLLTDETASLLGLDEDATPDNAFEMLSSLLIFKKIGAKVLYGTYTGTGVYGAGNPNTLNVGFKPLFFGVTLYSQKIQGTFGDYNGFDPSLGQVTGTVVRWSGAASNASLNPEADVHVNWGETYVQWYSDSVLHQMNQTTTYTYVVVGVGGTSDSGGTESESGKPGVGIEKIVQTTTSTEDGGVNVWTATLTDGSVYNFEVRNGSRGSDYVLTDADKTEIAEQAAALVDTSLLSIIGEVS